MEKEINKDYDKYNDYEDFEYKKEQFERKKYEKIKIKKNKRNKFIKSFCFLFLFIQIISNNDMCKINTGCELKVKAVTVNNIKKKDTENIEKSKIKSSVKTVSK